MRFCEKELVTDKDIKIVLIINKNIFLYIKYEKIN